MRATRRLAPLMAVCVLSVILDGAGCARVQEVEPLSPAMYYSAGTRAAELQKRGDFVQAAVLYERLVASFPDDARTWRMLATCRLEEKRYRDAARAFERALALKWDRDPNDWYRIARAYALAGDRDAALRALESALAAGFEGRANIADEPAFAALRGHPGFARAAGLPPARQLDRAEAWRSDIDYLVAEIRRLHYAYRAQPLPEGFEQAVATLRDHVASLRDEEIIVGLQGLLARLGDGHSKIQVSLGPRALRQLALQLYDFCDGLYVIGAPADLKRLIGARVVALGPLEPGEALARLTPYVSRDNPMFVRDKGPLLLTYPDFLHAIGASADPQHVSFTLLGRSGVRETVELQAGFAGPYETTLIPATLPGAPPVPLFLRRATEVYWFEALPEPKTLYVQFNQVADAPGETLADFALRLRGALDKQETKNLIVDVRHNTGGNATLLTQLLRTLVHFETTREEARLFVVTSRSTFSAAQIFVNEVDRLTNAVFVGEPSGSSPNFIGESTMVVLPSSGVIGNISSRYHQSDGRDFRYWIAPDIPVPVCSEDYFSNRDPALEAIREVIAAKS